MPLRSLPVFRGYFLFNVFRILCGFMIALRSVLLMKIWWLCRFFSFFNEAYSFWVARNATKILQNYLIWLIFVLKKIFELFFIIVVIRPVGYRFYWIFTKCHAKHCTHHTIVIRKHYKKTLRKHSFLFSFDMTNSTDFFNIFQGFLPSS